MQALTLPGIRDGVRQRLGVPISQTTSGDPGTQPRPTNTIINMVARDQAADLDATIGLGTASVFTLPIAAQTAPGPYTYSLTGAAWVPAVPAGGITSLRYAGWSVGVDTSNYQDVKVSSLAATELDHSNYLNDAPSSPLRAWFDNGVLWVYPAPGMDGILSATVETGVGGLDDDTTPFTLFPPNLQPAYMDIVACEVAASYPDDVEMRTRLQYLMPKAALGRGTIRRWNALQNSKPGGMRPWRYRKGRP